MIHATDGVRRAVKAGLRGVLIGCAAVLVGVSPATGQDLIAQANALYSDIVAERRSDPIFLPALVGLGEPPLGVETPEKAQMAFVGGRVWPAAERWVMEPGQRAALEALERITRSDRYETAMSLAQGYGIDGIPVDLIRARMYTDLGDPPLLSAARHLYMEKLDDLHTLVQLEATRLAGEGDPVAAMEVLVSLAKLGYQMADREMLNEARWGYEVMVSAARRIRDIAYADFRGDRKADPEGIREVIAALDPRNGAMRLDRLNFPRGNRIAAQQLIEAVYQRRGGVNASRFVPTMVRLASSEFPLRRFSAASTYEGLKGTQKDWFDIDTTLKDVFASWEKAWTLDRFDPVLALPFAWETDRVGDTSVVVRAGVGGDMGVLFDLRTLARLEFVGTRQALGLLGRFYVQGAFAPRMDGIRPRWVDVLEDDPFNANRAGNARPPMRYFRPVTDAHLADQRAQREPHRMEVFPGDGTNFEVVLFDDQFLVYSTGRDGQDNNGFRMNQDPDSLVGDYLIWPPMLGLHRVHLRQMGELD